MVTIATVCQSTVSSILLLDGNGAKTISVQLKEKKFHSRVEDHLKIDQEPITRSVQLPYSVCETAFSQVELFLDINAFRQISSQ